MENKFVPRFLSRLFGGNADGNTARAAAAKSSGLASSGLDQPLALISYDAELISKLKTDHAELFRLFGELKSAADRGECSLVPDLLRTFRLTLQTHLMLENVKFYAYLRQTIGTNSQQDNFVVDVKKEMDGIARVVVGFTKTYGTEAVVAEKLEAFKHELEGIGAVLTKRVQLEESRLYTLYLPTR